MNFKKPKIKVMKIKVLNSYRTWFKLQSAFFFLSQTFWLASTGVGCFFQKRQRRGTLYRAVSPDLLTFWFVVAGEAQVLIWICEFWMFTPVLFSPLLWQVRCHPGKNKKTILGKNVGDSKLFFQIKSNFVIFVVASLKAMGVVFNRH